MNFIELSFEVPKEFALPCASGCPFDKRCAEKYFDETQPWEDSCAKKIVDAIAREVSPYHSEAHAERNKLLFTTSRPDKHVDVSNGEIVVTKI